MDYPKDSWHLVVVDNGSRDKTLEILSAWQVKMHNFETVIYNEANKGFAAANNQGITYALKNSPDYIVLLNDDIVVEPNWLNVMIDKMEQNKDIGLAQPLITRYPEINKINTFGNACQFIGFGFCWLEGQDINLTLKNYQPAYLSFSAVVIRSEVFRQIMKILIFVSAPGSRIGIYLLSKVPLSIIATNFQAKKIKSDISGWKKTAII